MQMDFTFCQPSNHTLENLSDRTMMQVTDDGKAAEYPATHLHVIE